MFMWPFIKCNTKGLFRFIIKLYDFIKHRNNRGHSEASHTVFKHIVMWNRLFLY